MIPSRHSFSFVSDKSASTAVVDDASTERSMAYANIFLPAHHSFALVSDTRASTAVVVQNTATGSWKYADVFVPSQHSFLLTSRNGTRVAVIIDAPTHPNYQKGFFIASQHSFTLTTRQSTNEVIVTDAVVEGVDSIDTANADTATTDAAPVDTEHTDKDKRNFLKVAGVAGAGLVASQLLPSKADAYILGSSPTTGVVGVKNAANTRINPATEETLDQVLKTSDLAFDGSGNLNVNIASGGGTGTSSFSDISDVAKQALVDADRHVQVDVLSSVSTESTLQTISFGGVKYALRLVTVGDFDYIGEASIGSASSSPVWRVKRVDNTSGNISILWAGTGTFNQVWDNYASLTYV